jgi:hypothetical protein
LSFSAVQKGALMCQECPVGDLRRHHDS